MSFTSFCCIPWTVQIVILGRIGYERGTPFGRFIVFTCPTGRAVRPTGDSLCSPGGGIYLFSEDETVHLRAKRP